MNLKQIIVETKLAVVPFEGIDGFEVKIAALSRELSRKIRKESEVSRLDPKLRVATVELDQELFIRKFAEAAVKGWTGLKCKHLPDLILGDFSLVEDPEEEVTFNLENAIDLITHSQIFDSWINEQVFSLHRFRD
jgi:hypothetical protein